MTDGAEFDEAVDDLAEAEGDRRYSSLNDAFRDRGTTLANQIFLRQLFAGIDVEGYYGMSSYLKVARRSGAPALHVHHGWTNGFQSRDEVVSSVGEAPIWRSTRLRDTWGVTHPDHGPGHDGGDRGRGKRDGGSCPVCGDVLPLSGVCNFCG